MHPFLDKQLTFLEWIAKTRGSFLDHILLFWNFFDTPIFFLLLVPFIWIGLSWKWGSRLFYLVILSGFTNHLLKELFAVPRPCFWSPEIALIPCRSYSFPSGGAQTAALLAGFIWLSYPKPWAKTVAIVFALCMGASRFLLGVHYPTDVLGGYFVGLALIIAFSYAHRPIALAVTRKPYLSLGICSFVCLFLSFFVSLKTVILFGVLLGGSVGVFTSGMFFLYLPDPTHAIPAILRGCFGVLGAYIIWSLFPALLKNTNPWILFFEGFTLALWVSLFAHILLKGLLRMGARGK